MENVEKNNQNSDQSITNSDQLPSSYPSQQEPSKLQPLSSPPINSSFNYPLLIMSLAMFLLAIAAVGYVFYLNKFNNLKPKRNNIVSPTPNSNSVFPSGEITNNPTTIVPTPTTVNTSTVTTAPTQFILVSPTPTKTNKKVPVGYKEKTTLCYRITIPVGARVSENNSCHQYITNSISSKYIYTIHIDPIYMDPKYQSVTDLVNNRIIDSTYKLVEDENIMLNGIPARKLTEKNTKLNLSRIRIFVFTPNKYKMSGVKLAGFEISMTLDGNTSQENQSYIKEILTTLISNWQWQ